MRWKKINWLLNVLLIFTLFIEGDDETRSLTDRSEARDRKITFEEILQRVGEFGRYQKFVYILVCLLAVVSGINTIISVFLLAIPDHRLVILVVWC